MSVDQDITLLEQVPMLRVLGRGILRTLAVAAETRQVQTGEMLFAPNEKPDCAFVVQEGLFALSIDPENSQRVIEAGPGTMLGEFALLTEAARPLSAVAQQPSAVMRISRSMFMKILDNDADAAVRLHGYVARRTRQSVADLLAAKDAFDRNG
ncbi:MAG: Crp/Fnr family transcriptional regulator [Pseudorhodoplanes sp.]